MRDTAERFWSRVGKKEPDDCWEWLGCKSGYGYGVFWFNGRRIGAHRVAYELVVGPIPQGAVICHRCDNTSCCNPAHLFAGSQADNMRDALQKDRMAVATITRKQAQWLKDQVNSGAMSRREVAIVLDISYTQACYIMRQDAREKAEQLAALTKERDEARLWARRLLSEIWTGDIVRDSFRQMPEWLVEDLEEMECGVGDDEP